MLDATQTELQLIAHDTAELMQLCISVSKNVDVSVIGFGLPPFIGLVAEESFRYLSSPARQQASNRLAEPLFATFAENVTKVRARAKLFDDTRGGLDGLIAMLALSYQKSVAWFMYPHQGLLAGLKRRLQPDLGIYYFDEHVIVTTHTVPLTIGLTHEQLNAIGVDGFRELRPFAKTFSSAMGAYLGQLAAYLREQGYGVEARTVLNGADIKLPITHNDHFGRGVYTYVAKRCGLRQRGLSTAIIFLLAQVNFVERVLPYFLLPTSTLLLRARFLTAYHASRALRQLDEERVFSEGYRNIVRDILGEPDAVFLLATSQVRNIMAHYELRGAARFLTSGGDPLNDVLLGLCQRGREDVAAIAQRQLLRISEACIGVLSKTSLKRSRALLGNHT